MTVMFKSAMPSDVPRAKNVPATARLVDGLRCELTGPYAVSSLTTRQGGIIRYARAAGPP